MIGELTNHVWQSTLFAAAAGLLAVAFRKNRAAVRYWLWLSASLKFFVPFALLLNLGRQLDVPPPARVPAQSISIAMQQIAQPFSDTLPQAPLTSNPRKLPVAILAVWACGFAAVTLIRLRDWRRIRAAVRASTASNLSTTLDIRSSPGLLEPGVVGLWRPVLLLPEGIADRLTPPQLQTVLAHELCHVRRRDNLFAGIHMLVEAIFWFHPLVWWIGARLVEERERACDEGVLSLCGEPRIYADAILNVCKLYVESPLVCVSGVTGANLKRRIEAIMTNRMGQELNRARKLLLAGAAVVALAGPVAIGILIGIGHAPLLHSQALRGQAPVPQPERRPVAILFDPGSMTPTEQSRALESATDFVQNKMRPADIVAVMVADNGKVAVVQDFTNDQAVLQAALRFSGRDPLGRAEGSKSGAAAKFSSIETAARLLAVLPGKKGLMYFAGGVALSAVEYQAELQHAIDLLQKSDVAIYSIDVREAQGQPQPTAPIESLPGRHAGFQIHPAGESQTLVVPLDSLSGTLEIVAQVKTRPAGQEFAAVRDNVQASAGTFQANFILPAGSYACGLIVRERATGRMYQETIDFEVK